MPELMFALHVPETVPELLTQLIPPTLLATDPDPVPLMATFTGNADGMKLAVTD